MSVGPAPATLVPHAGDMCLLDAVLDWDGSRVTCASGSHRRVDHPLRRDGRLAGVHLLEYAAQATAVHGALAAGDGGAGPVKYVGAFRDCELRVADLDRVPGDLLVEAERIMAMGDGALYRFRIRAEGRLLAEGRLTVVAPGGGAP